MNRLWIIGYLIGIDWKQYIPMADCPNFHQSAFVAQTGIKPSIVRLRVTECDLMSKLLLAQMLLKVML